jgi:peptide-methionine (S)-S-oxide reductase
MQEMFRRLRGVVSTRVGYAGGDIANPSYGNHQGHAEAIQIVFDPAVVSYRAVLEHFFQVHEPTTYEQQGSDFGRSYRSAIFYTDEQQKETALATIAEIEASDGGPVPW